MISSFMVAFAIVTSLLLLIFYVNNVHPSLFFCNFIGTGLVLAVSMVYAYKQWRYPYLNYEGMVRVFPLIAGLSFVVTTIPLLMGWFKWDDKYDKIFMLVKQIKDNRADQKRYLFLGFGLILVQTYIDGWLSLLFDMLFYS